MAATKKAKGAQQTPRGIACNIVIGVIVMGVISLLCICFPLILPVVTPTSNVGELKTVVPSERLQDDGSLILDYLDESQFMVPLWRPDNDEPISRRRKPIQILRRQELGWLLNIMGFTTGAEVGVQTGSFALTTLENWQSCTKYYLIDVWEHQPNIVDPGNVDTDEHLRRMEEAKRKLAPYESKLVWMRMTSLAAASKIPDNSLDYVFIDARQDYCGVTEDLKTYWPKVKVSGIFAGHDFVDGTEEYVVKAGNNYSVCADGSVKHGAVKRAVLDFLKSKNIPEDELIVCKDDLRIDNYPCFYLLKRFE